jgi:beta-glucosidase
LALNAGIEMDMVGEGFDYVKKSLDEDVSTGQIDNAVRLILNTKYDLGLFQDPKYCDENRAKLKYSQQTTELKPEKLHLNLWFCLKTKPTASSKKNRNYRLIGPLADQRKYGGYLECGN